MSKILITDDEERIRDIIRQYLEFEGFEYGEAGDGVEAFDQVKTGEYDLVVLDVMMPKSDGITTLRKIREISSIPVILLTAKGEEYDKIFGFDLGADDYVVKPFSPKELTHIKMLRSNLGPYRNLIKTIWGVGYKYEEYSD